MSLQQSLAYGKDSKSIKHKILQRENSQEEENRNNVVGAREGGIQERGRHPQWKDQEKE